MRIFVAGATGTLGLPVVRLLRDRGHEVTGLTRSPERRSVLEPLGIHAAVGDALDADTLDPIVIAARPDVVVHVLTALPPGGAPRPRQLRATNELRMTATANLVRAALAAEARRLVAESFAAIYASATNDSPASEEDGLGPVGDGPLRETRLALRSLEDQLHTARQTNKIDTVALRFGLLYGPGVPSTELLVEQARAGRLFAPRGMSGVGPCVHISDAAAAVVAAVERPGPSAVYNIVDDEPVAIGAFLTALARAVGARPPRQVPAWIVRLAAPVMAELGSARLQLSNAKAKRELAWSLRYPTIREGLAVLAQGTVAAT